MWCKIPPLSPHPHRTADEAKGWEKEKGRVQLKMPLFGSTQSSSNTKLVGVCRFVFFFSVPGLSSDIWWDGVDEVRCLYQVLLSSRAFLQARGANVSL